MKKELRFGKTGTNEKNGKTTSLGADEKDCAQLTVSEQCGAVQMLVPATRCTLYVCTHHTAVRKYFVQHHTEQPRQDVSTAEDLD